MRMSTGRIVSITWTIAALIGLLMSAKPGLAASKTIRVVVAANGSGNFTTIQQAIDHAPPEGNGRLIIAIRPGVYRQRLVVPQDRPRVTFLGLGKNPSDTVITYSMSAKEAGGTFVSSTVDAEGTEFEARNVTFENTFGPGSQAVALSIHSDRAIFQHCRFIGWQDTLYAAYGRQYYHDCFIEGAVDFIFGNAAAVFDHCVIESVGNGYITAQSRVVPNGATGFVFYHCRLTAKPDVRTYLGRPWRPYSRVIYIDCWMGNQIRPSGWNNWNNPANEKTAWYTEYGCSGPGAKRQDRVKWERKLTSAEVQQFLPDNFLRGNDGWHPAQGSGK